MDTRTVRYYDEFADSVADTYEQVDFSDPLRKYIDLLPAHAGLLDIGSGSGRDAAHLIGMGYDVQIADASARLLDAAVSRHPELSGRTTHASLPGPLPYKDGRFAGVSAWAVLMHIPAESQLSAFAEIARVVREGGILAYSVNTERSGMNESGIDSRGRLFVCRDSDLWEDLHIESGFTTIERVETNDITGRAGIRWVTFYCRRM